MATIVFAAAGSAFFGAAATSLGATAIGASIAASIGGSILGFVGSQVDTALLGIGNTASNRSSSTTQLNQSLISTYGTAIPIGYGILRVGGNVIWASDVRLVTVEQTETVRTGKFSSEDVVTSRDEKAYIDLAVAFLSVPSDANESNTSTETSDDDEIQTDNRNSLIGIRRIWANNDLVYDGRTFNDIAQIKGFDFSALYDGAETQNPDEYIESIEGVDQVPAFRGTAYIVIKDLDLVPLGNRIPAINIEAVATLPRVFLQDGVEGITEGLDSSIYLVSHTQRTIERINGTTLSTIARIGANGTEYLGTLKAHPWRIACSPTTGYIWITCKGDSFVQVINPATNTVIQSIAVHDYPNDIAIDASGNAWVTFPYSDEIAKITGAYSVTYYSVASSPFSICVDTSGSVYVTTTQHVRKFNSSGVQQWATNIGYFPWGIDYNPVSGELWVALTGENHLVILNTSGGIVRRRNTGTYPTHVDINPADTYGSVAVTTYLGNQLKVYSKTYNELLAYGTVAFPGPCFCRPDGRIFISQTKYNFAMVADGR